MLSTLSLYSFVVPVRLTTHINDFLIIFTDGLPLIININNKLPVDCLVKYIIVLFKLVNIISGSFTNRSFYMAIESLIHQMIMYIIKHDEAKKIK